MLRSSHVAKIKNYSIAVKLKPEALQNVSELNARTGLKKVQIVNRVINWFADQDELTQLSILGIFTDKTAAEVTQLVLAKMGGHPPPQVLDRVA